MKDHNQILAELTYVFHQVFRDNSINIDINTTADDIGKWDSLTHMTLISEIEQHFTCEFSFGEVMSFKNVGDIVNTIQRKQ